MLRYNYLGVFNWCSKIPSLSASYLWTVEDKLCYEVEEWPIPHSIDGPRVVFLSLFAVNWIIILFSPFFFHSVANAPNF